MAGGLLKTPPPPLRLEDPVRKRMCTHSLRTVAWQAVPVGERERFIEI